MYTFFEDTEPLANTLCRCRIALVEIRGQASPASLWGAGGGGRVGNSGPSHPTPPLLLPSLSTLPILYWFNHLYRAADSSLNFHCCLLFIVHAQLASTRNRDCFKVSKHSVTHTIDKGKGTYWSVSHWQTTEFMMDVRRSVDRYYQ